MSQVFLPYFESIPVGSSSGASSSLIAGYRYLHFTTPQYERIWLVGFSANFQDVAIRLTLSQQNKPDVWVPFYNTQMTALIGADGQAEPVLLLPRAFPLEPFSRIQIAIQNTSGSNFSNTILTMVGVRERRPYVAT